MEIKVEPTFLHVTWIVKDVLQLPQKDDFYLDSPTFLFGGDSYSLRFHPKMNHSYNSITKFILLRMSETFPERKVSCKIGIKKIGSAGDDWYDNNTTLTGRSNACRRFWQQEEIDKYVSDGNLAIVGSMWLNQESGAGSVAQEGEDHGGFPGHYAPFMSRWSSPKMELLTESPCTRVVLDIPNYPDLPRETCNSLTSPEFRFAGDTYCFQFRPNGDTHDTDLLLVRLTFINPARTSYRVGYSGAYDRYSKNSRSLDGNTGFCITRSKLEKGCKYVRDGILRLLLFLRLEEQCSAGAQKQTGLSGIDSLQSDYCQLLQNGTESDVCIVVRGKEFHVHRSVLRARSTVFKAMFDYYTADKEESRRLVINDLEPESFGDFLEYLYTGDIQDNLTEDNAFGLYVTANGFDISTLKSECVEYMRHILTVVSFCDVLNLAVRHSEEDLVQHCASFFKANMKHIIRTAGWQQFMSANSTSANELFMKSLVPRKQ